MRCLVSPLVLILLDVSWQNGLTWARASLVAEPQAGACTEEGSQKFPWGTCPQGGSSSSLSWPRYEQPQLIWAQVHENSLSALHQKRSPTRVGLRCPCVGVCSLQWLWVFFSLSFCLSDCLAWILTTFTTVPPDSQGSPESRTGRNLSYAIPDGEVSRGRPRTLITGRGVRTQVSRLSPTPAFRQLWTCPSLPYGISWLPKAWGHSPPKHTLCVSVGMALPPYSVASSSIHSVNVSWVSLKEMGHIGGLEAWERSAQIGVDSGKGAGGVRPVRRGFSIQGRKCESLK